MNRPDNLSAARGLCYALLISAPVWALIGLGVWILGRK